MMARRGAHGGVAARLLTAMALAALMPSAALAAAARPAAAAGPAAQPPALSADEWKQAATTDIEAAYLVTLDDHPGVYDPANPVFAQNLEKAREGALAMAAQVRDGAGYGAALQHFNGLIRDGRAGVVLRDVPTVPLRWPGFISAWRGENMFVTATTPGGPAVGARIADCDGTPIAQLVERNVFEFGTRSGGMGPWWAYAADVFIDQGNPFVTLPVQCIFIDEGRESRLTLTWRDMDDGAQRLRDDSFNGVPLPIGVTQPRKGLYWFALPTFQPNDAERLAYGAMLQDVQANRARYLDADAVVIDLRGNQGGNPSWGVDFARALWGQARVDRRMRLATGEVAWSASSSWMSDVSRAAVLARMVATPSSRLSSSARAASPMSASALTLARSSRTRNAITWNLTRLVGPSFPRWDLASISRTLRARIGMRGASSSRRDDFLRRVAAVAVVGMLLLSVKAGTPQGLRRSVVRVWREPGPCGCRSIISPMRAGRGRFDDDCDHSTPSRARNSRGDARGGPIRRSAGAARAPHPPRRRRSAP